MISITGIQKMVLEEIFIEACLEDIWHIFRPPPLKNKILVMPLSIDLVFFLSYTIYMSMDWSAVRIFHYLHLLERSTARCVWGAMSIYWSTAMIFNIFTTFREIYCPLCVGVLEDPEELHLHLINTHPQEWLEKKIILEKLYK